MLHSLDDFYPGTLLEDGEHSVYLVPEQDDDHHLNGMLIYLFTGKLVHFSHLETPVKPILHNEVMW